ncbi:MAG TPA: glycosyltransferase family 2 protein [Thermoanaerobaculia bacterium]|nr:glycosyltransferase family 2 protein [Thermoanaerobaculia bacterium]
MSSYAVAVVSFNSAEDLPGWFESVAALQPAPAEVVVVDNASRDGSAELAGSLAERWLPGAQVLTLEENLGFAGGANRAFAATRAPFLLLLNPDARPQEDFAAALLARLEAASEAGAATGRLIRPPIEGEAPRLDACGMRLTWTWRHLDLGSGEPDLGQFSQPAQVFGATGAAVMLRREAAADVAVGGEVFDTLFHSFREDAELCFRLWERGWAVLYEPRAIAQHRRFNLPSRRRQMPPEVNFHSLKNRYLLRLYHQSGWNFWLTAPATLLRDLGALLYVLLRERSSLAAYRWLWQRRREILARRREIRARRSAGTWSVDQWFFRRERPLARREARREGV